VKIQSLGLFALCALDKLGPEIEISVSRRSLWSETRWGRGRSVDVRFFFIQFPSAHKMRLISSTAVHKLRPGKIFSSKFKPQKCVNNYPCN